MEAGILSCLFPFLVQACISFLAVEKSFCGRADLLRSNWLAWKLTVMTRPGIWANSSRVSGAACVRLTGRIRQNTNRPAARAPARESRQLEKGAQCQTLLPSLVRSAHPG